MTDSERDKMLIEIHSATQVLKAQVDALPCGQHSEMLKGLTLGWAYRKGVLAGMILVGGFVGGLVVAFFTWALKKV